MYVPASSNCTDLIVNVDITVTLFTLVVVTKALPLEMALIGMLCVDIDQLTNGNGIPLTSQLKLTVSKTFINRSWLEGDSKLKAT